MSTTVVPSTGESLPETFEIDNPSIGARDLRGVELVGALPTRYPAGDRVSMAGRVTAADPVDFNQALIRFDKFGGSADDAVRFSATVSRSRDFTVPIQFTLSQRGRYSVSVFLFWPTAGRSSRAAS